MKIRTVSIRSFRKGSSVCRQEGLRHIKTLPWLSVVQSQSGHYGIRVGNGAEAQTAPGGFFVAPSREIQNIVHHVDPDTGEMKCRWIFLDVRVNGDAFADDVAEFPLIPGQTGVLGQLFDGIFSADDPFDEMAGCYAVLKVLFSAADLRENRIPPALAPLPEYVRTHCAEPLCVADLAQVCHLSESGFYPIFRRAFGVSPMAYVNHHRLTVAADLLLTTELPIRQISAVVGIADPYYFSRAFRKTFGRSPRNYRARILE